VLLRLFEALKTVARQRKKLARRHYRMIRAT
jgi:hypothetical protein